MHGETIYEYKLLGLFMSTFDNQSMSIGCVGKSGHLFGFLRHYLLRLQGTYATKWSKNQTPLHISLNNPTARPSFKKLYDTFWPSDQRFQKYVTCEKWPLMAELKLNVAEFAKFCIFFIPALPLEVTFKMWTYFWHLWPLGQKSIIQIFERWSKSGVI